MAVVVAATVEAERVRYEIRCPKTGRLLGYLAGSEVERGSPLCAALAENGLRLVPVPAVAGEPAPALPRP
jgi:hypothetical protein